VEGTIVVICFPVMTEKSALCHIQTGYMMFIIAWSRIFWVVVPLSVLTGKNALLVTVAKMLNTYMSETTLHLVRLIV